MDRNDALTTYNLIERFYMADANTITGKRLAYFDAKRRRWVVDISRTVAGPHGRSKRIRKTKTLAPSTTEAQAAEIAASMEAEVLAATFKDVKIRTAASLIEIGSAPAKAAGSGCSDEWSSYVDDMLSNRGSWIYKALSSSRTRALKAKVPHTITPESLAALLKASGGRCVVSGVKFSAEGPGVSRTKPMQHSIDRRTPCAGYTQENIRIVCNAVNVAMSDWGEDVFAAIAKSYLINQYGSTGELQK